jgi:hypothetical protein
LVRWVSSAGDFCVPATGGLGVSEVDPAVAPVGRGSEFEAVFEHDAAGSVGFEVGGFIGGDNELVGGGLPEQARDEEAEVMAAAEPFVHPGEAFFFVEGLFEAAEEVAGVALDELAGAVPAAGGDARVEFGARKLMWE